MADIKCEAKHRGKLRIRCGSPMLTSTDKVDITNSHTEWASWGAPCASGMRTVTGTYLDTDMAVAAALSPRWTSMVQARHGYVLRCARAPRGNVGRGVCMNIVVIRVFIVREGDETRHGYVVVVPRVSRVRPTKERREC